MKRILFILGVLLLAITQGYGQAAITYSLSKSVGDYTELGSDEIVLPNKFYGSAFNGVFFVKDDAFVPTTTATLYDGIPFFDFDFCGTTVNSFAVSANGILMLGKDQISIRTGISSGGFTSSYTKNAIFSQPCSGAYADAAVHAKPEGDSDPTKLSYKIIEEAGDKVLCVQFKNLMVHLPAASAQFPLSFQIYLRQSTGQITIAYYKELQPAEDQKMWMTVGMLTSSSDRRAMDYASGETDWNKATYSTNTGRKLTLTSTSKPSKGFGFTLSKPAPCETPGDIKVTYTRTSLTSNSFGGRFAFPNEDADGALIVFADTPELSGSPENGKTYSNNNAIGNGTVISNYNAITNMTVSRSSLTPGATYYIHVFPYNYLCAGKTPLYREEAHVEPIEIIFGAPEVTVSKTDFSEIELDIQAASGRKVIVARSLREWDKTMDNSDPVLPEDVKIGDVINAALVEQKGYPPLTVYYMGEAGKLTIPSEPATNYYFTLWSYDDEGEGYVYSTIYNTTKARSSSSAPLEINFTRDAIVSVPTNATAPPAMPAGWERSIVNTTRYSDNFTTGLYKSRSSDPIRDENKRLEININKVSNTNGIAQRADAISPIITAPETKAYELSYSFKITKQSFQYVDAATYTLAESDSLFVQYNINGGEWMPLDTVHHAKAPDTFDKKGYSMNKVRFPANKNDNIRIRFEAVSATTYLFFVIKDIYLEQILDCAYPVDIACVEEVTTGKSLDITWGNSEAASEYRLSYRIAEFDAPWSDEVKVDKHPFHLTGLDSYTAYQVRMRSVCGENDTSLWTRASQTLWTHIGLPYEQKFDGLPANPNPLPSGFSTYSSQLNEEGQTKKTETTTNATGWVVMRATVASATDNYAAIVKPNTNNTWFEFPPISLGEYPVPASMKFNLSLYKIVSNQAVADAIEQKGCLFSIVVGKGLDDFTTADIIKQFGTPTEERDDIEPLKELLDTPITIDLSDYSGTIKLGFYWQRPDDSDIATALKDHWLAIDNLTISYTDITPCDSARNISHNDVLTDRATISWSGDAYEYAVVYREVGSTEDPDTLYTTNNRITLTGLTDNTEYTYQVQSLCAPDHQNPGLISPEYRFTTVEISCRVPVEFTVTERTYNTATFAYTSAEDNVQLQIWPQDNGSEVRLLDFTGSPVTIDNLSPARLYNARIRAVCAGEETSEWGAVVQFTTEEVPVCETPENLASDVRSHEEATLTWKNGGTNVSYVVYYRAEDDVDFEEKEVVETTLDLTGLSPETVYIWKVKGICADGLESELSEDKQFLTGSVSIPGNSDTNSPDFRVAASEGVITVFNPGYHEITQITVYDLSGKIIIGKEVKSRENIAIRIGNQSGFVIVRIVSGTTVKSHKVVLK